MDTSRPPLPSWVVLNILVSDFEYITVERDQRWAAVGCASKKAYGCGEYGQLVVEGLTLLVLLPDHSDLSSDLSIRASDEVFRCIQEEHALDREELCLTAYVETVDKNLIVVTVSFSSRDDCSYYLVYDAISASLSMIRHLPRCCQVSSTQRPLPVTCADGGDYALVLIARSMEHQGEQGCVHRDVLCLWHPTPSSPRPPAESVCASIGPWKMKERRFPQVMPAFFTTDVVFSFKAQAFWVDLGRGILCCDSSDMFTGADLVDFCFIDLPLGCFVDIFEKDMRRMPPMEMYRTMGCSGDSIKFVNMEGPRHLTVTVWTLNLDLQQWTKDQVLVLSSLCELDGFKEAGLRDVPPKWPILREQEDGALYFLLHKIRLAREKPAVSYICGVDMRSRSLMMSSCLSITDILVPVILPSNVFRYLDLLVSSGGIGGREHAERQQDNSRYLSVLELDSPDDEM